MSALASRDLVGFRLPDAACDCHVHVIGAPSAYPMRAGRAYTPGLASTAQLRAHMARLGLQRAIIVQPSVYGTDHRCLLDALAVLDGVARGIAVPSEDMAQAGLRELHARGIRGVRVNLESERGEDSDLREVARSRLVRWSARVADLGWHLQLYADWALVAELADLIVRLPTPVVLDHFALAAIPPGPAAGMLLHDLLRSGHVLVKCSAPYRLADPSLAPAWTKALTAAAPDAVLWGSDWPHTGRMAGAPADQVSPYRDVSADDLRQGMIDGFATEAMVRQVLVATPVRLYGF